MTELDPEKCNMGPAWCEGEFAGVLSCDSLLTVHPNSSTGDYKCPDCGHVAPKAEMRKRYVESGGK